MGFAGTARRRHLGVAALVTGVAVLLSALVAGLVLGPTSIRASGTLLEVLDRVTGLRLRTGLGPLEAAIVWQVRAPTVALETVPLDRTYPPPVAPVGLGEPS